MTSFTCLYTVVTSKIVVWTRWWTWVTFFFYTFMSIFVYIEYVWFSNYWSGSLVRYSVVQLHKSPLFWLCLFLIGAASFLGDMAYEFFRLRYFKTCSDYVRELLQSRAGLCVRPGGSVDISEADVQALKEFMEPIKTHYRVKDKMKEDKLTKLRNRYLGL